MALGYVRPARPEDVAGMARIQLTTWRYAYRRLLPQDVLDQFDEAWLAQRWHEAVTAPPTPRHHVYVAVEQQEAGQEHLVGFAAAGPLDAEALAPDEQDAQAGGATEIDLATGRPHLSGAEVAAVTELLVEPRWGRRGHGSRLLAALVDTWRADGFDTAVAWVYERDPASRAFLTSAGWAPDGATRALDVEDMLVPQLRLHVSLDPESGTQQEPGTQPEPGTQQEPGQPSG